MVAVALVPPQVEWFTLVWLFINVCVGIEK